MGLVFVKDMTKSILVCLSGPSSNCRSLAKHEFQIPHGSVKILFRWGGRRLHFCTTNLLRTIDTKFYQNRLGFYRASYASTVLAVIVCLSVRPSVRPSVTSRSCRKLAKPRITIRTAYDSPGTLVFWRQKSSRNSNDIISNGGAK